MLTIDTDIERNWRDSPGYSLNNTDNAGSAISIQHSSKYAYLSQFNGISLTEIEEGESTSAEIGEVTYTPKQWELLVFQNLTYGHLAASVLILVSQFLKKKGHYNSG